jgi:hypothetical protein
MASSSRSPLAGAAEIGVERHGDEDVLHLPALLVVDAEDAAYEQLLDHDPVHGLPRVLTDGADR